MDDEVPDTEARPSGWTGDDADAADPVGRAAEPRVRALPGRGEAVVPPGEAAQAAQPAQSAETETASVTFLGEFVGSESDVDIDLPPWVCHFNDGSMRF
eukprot:1938337-Amphidinium_carterae.1